MSCGLPVAPHVISPSRGPWLTTVPTRDSFTRHNCLMPHVRQFDPAQLSHVVSQLPNSGEIRTPVPSSGGFRTLRGLRTSNCRPRSQLVSESGPKARRASESRPAALAVPESRPAARRATTSRQKVRNRTRSYRAAAKTRHREGTGLLVLLEPATGIEPATR